MGVGRCEVVVDWGRRESSRCWSCRQAYSYRLGTTFFFFVYSYWRTTYIDPGGVHFVRFSCPQSVGIYGSIEVKIVN